MENASISIFFPVFNFFLTTNEGFLTLIIILAGNNFKLNH